MLVGQPGFGDGIGLLLLAEAAADGRHDKRGRYDVNRDRKYQEPPGSGGKRYDRADHDGHREREHDE